MKLAVYILFTVGSCLLVFASYQRVLPITLTETFGFLTGLLSVWLVVQENVWNWPVGIVNNIFFVIVFWKSRLFADMALQFLYIVLGILGWHQWLYGGEKKSQLKISSATWVHAAIFVPLCFFCTGGMTLYLRSMHDSAPFLDAFTTVLSLIAQYLLTKKFLENWHVWIAADLIYIGLYLYRSLFLTSLLYLIFLSMCVAGWKAWRDSLSRLATPPSLQPELRVP